MSSKPPERKNPLYTNANNFIDLFKLFATKFIDWDRFGPIKVDWGGSGGSGGSKTTPRDPFSYLSAYFFDFWGPKPTRFDPFWSILVTSDLKTGSNLWGF